MEPRLNIAFLHGRVGHARLWPKKNSFIYRVFYTKILITEEMDYKTPFLFSFNRWNLFSMYTKDYGSRDKDISWNAFITLELAKAGISLRKDNLIYLISHPRLFGFAFNPISYWVVVDGKGNLRAILCEVHNTFKETHNYLLTKIDNAPIKPVDFFIAYKKLYVSPFNKTEGHYEFNFTLKKDFFRSLINYFDASGKFILTTYVQGKVSRLTSRNILQSVVLYPAMTLLVVIRIHWQALKIFIKRVKPTLDLRSEKYTNNQTTVSTKMK
jgi:uncharacterized protein